MLKESDEVYDLPTGPVGFSQGERSDCRREVAKVPFDPRHKAGDVQVIYLELLYIDQCGKLALGAAVK